MCATVIRRHTLRGGGQRGVRRLVSDSFDVDLLRTQDQVCGLIYGVGSIFQETLDLIERSHRLVAKTESRVCVVMVADIWICLESLVLTCDRLVGYSCADELWVGNMLMIVLFIVLA